MDWICVALEWVNCLQLTETSISRIEELGDGKFFCEVLHLLFNRSVDIRNKAKVFGVLQVSLKGCFCPPDWIDYSKAFDGNCRELVKILSVLIGVGSLQSKGNMFLDRPLDYLSFDAQVELRKFLGIALRNGKVLNFGFSSEFSTEVYREKTSFLTPMTPSVSFPRDGEGSVPGSPNMCATFPEKEMPKWSPLRDILSSPILEAERLVISEKNDEIAHLKHQIQGLMACQRDLIDDLSSYKDENEKLSQRVEDMDQENQSLQLDANLNGAFSGFNSPEEQSISEKSGDDSEELKIKLKLADDYINELEAHIFDQNTRIEYLQSELQKSDESVTTFINQKNSITAQLKDLQQKSDEAVKILTGEKESTVQLEQCNAVSRSSRRRKRNAMKKMAVNDDRSRSQTATPREVKRSVNPFTRYFERVDSNT